MAQIHARFKLESTKRTAIFRPGHDVDFEQKGWGTTVKLSQVQDDGMAGKLEMVLGAAEGKAFIDAAIGAEFDVVVSLAKEA